MPSPAPVADRIRQLTALAGPLKTVEQRTAARERAEAKLAEADRAWREAIEAGLAAGAAVNDVAAAAKVHRSRVWQLTRKPKTVEQ